MQSNFFRPVVNSLRRLLSLLLVAMALSPSLRGQDKPANAQANPNAKPAVEIEDEPKTVDPATLVPKFLSVPVTVEFKSVPLKSVFNWLQQEQSINLLVDYKALAVAKILETEPVNESLKDAPLYLLLNRLEVLGVGWYVQEDSLYITSQSVYQTLQRTQQYPVGDLFDAGYMADDLLRTIRRASGGKWEGTTKSEDSGSLLLLGDVLFIRQTDHVQLEVSGLLKALRQHGRRTLTLDSPRHAELREVMQQKLSVDFQETPLIFAIQTIAEQMQKDIRLDRTALGKSTVRERTPVTLKLTDQKLSVVLRAMLSNLNLGWYLRDEVLWITTTDVAAGFRKSAVYDVRDLCRDQNESKALREAIQSQTRSDWRPPSDAGGIIESPRPGVLVIRHTEATLNEVLQLLNDYRLALRASKARKVASSDPNEVVVGYYRLPRPMAIDLKVRLPRMVAPGTWQTFELPDAPGIIEEVSVDAKGGIASSKANAVEHSAILSENEVLVIHQTRAAHRLIGKLISALMESKNVDLDAGSDVNIRPQVPSLGFGSNLIPGEK